jgi:hypothetical protein
MQNFLDIDQVDPQKLRGILDEAARIKTARAGLSKGMLDAERPLEGKMVALIFRKAIHAHPCELSISGCGRWAVRPWFCPAVRCSWAMGKPLRIQRGS